MSRASILAVILAAAPQAACLVQVTQVADASPLFEQARREALRHQGRPGPARELNVLVYERGDRKLVRVSLPMWFVRAAERRAHWHKELEDDDDEVVRHVRRHVRLEDIEKAGLGILVEVDEEDGEQVLVWLR
jgi:hypothetical protein